MISVHQLHKAYGTKAVLCGVDVHFSTRQVTSLIGPNGAGKSTLLMMIARLLEPSGGDILLEGRNVRDIATGDYARRVATLRQARGTRYPDPVKAALDAAIQPDGSIKESATPELPGGESGSRRGGTGASYHGGEECTCGGEGCTAVG